MSRSTVLVAFVVMVAFLNASSVYAAFPQGNQWCTIEGCSVPSPDAINRVLQQENQQFGQGPAKCGDGACNVVAGETCATCSQDCGQCKRTEAVTKCKSPNQWALTFDDGPSEFTESLVKTLNDAKVKATFFAIGNNIATSGEKAVNGMKLAFQSGHEIGSHTYTHRSLSEKILVKNGGGDEKGLPDGIQDTKESRLSFIRAELAFTDDAVKSVTGKLPRFVRPPFLDVSPETLSQMETMGYVAININVDSKDFTLVGKDNANPQTVLQQLKDAFQTARPEGSWISLQHDIHEFSVQAVRDVIDFVRSQSAELVPMSVCIGEEPYRADNANQFLSAEAAKNSPQQGGRGNGTGGGVRQGGTSPPPTGGQTGGPQLPPPTNGRGNGGAGGNRGNNRRGDGQRGGVMRGISDGLIDCT